MIFFYFRKKANFKNPDILLNTFIIISMYDIYFIYFLTMLNIQWVNVNGESTKLLTQFWNLIFNIFARNYAETYNYVLLWIYSIFTLSHIKV